MCSGEMNSLRVIDFNNLGGIIGKIFSILVSQIYGGFLISNYFSWILHLDIAMIGSDNQIDIFIRQFFNQSKQGGMYKQGKRQ